MASRKAGYNCSTPLHARTAHPGSRSPLRVSAIQTGTFGSACPGSGLANPQQAKTCVRQQPSSPRARREMLRPSIRPAALASARFPAQRAPLHCGVEVSGRALSITLPRHHSEGLPLYPQRWAAATITHGLRRGTQGVISGAGDPLFPPGCHTALVGNFSLPSMIRPKSANSAGCF